jgi:hypothetical protein
MNSDKCYITRIKNKGLVIHFALGKGIEDFRKRSSLNEVLVGD